MPLYDDDDGYMLGSLGLDDDQWQMSGPRRRGRRGGGRPNTMILPITFPLYTFVLATGTAAVTQNVIPQFPFAGAQPIATILRNGTSAAASLPLLTNLLVGPTPIVQTAPGLPLDGYSKDAVNNNLRIPPTGLGQTYRADVALTSALTGTDSISVLLQINGQARLRPGYVGGF
jgi:hypothetical protein